MADREKGVGPQSLESQGKRTKVDAKLFGPQRRLFPPVPVWSIAVVCVAAVTWIRLRTVTGDHAVVNVLTLILSFVGFCALATWFLFFSSYPRRVRLGVFGCGILGVILLACLYRVDNVSGELVPTFKLRWAPHSDELLDVPDVADSDQGVDLLTTTDSDFPQFLGPNRNLRVDHISLDRDWSARPPELVWRQPIGAGWSSFSVVNGFAVTMEQRGDEELVTCYEVATGEMQWARGVVTRHSTIMGGVGPRCTPTVHEGRVYALGATGALHCLDGSTGSVIWDDNVLRRYGVSFEEEPKGVAWGRAASPLVVDGLLVVPVGGPVGGPHVSLAAFNKDTGELVWEGGDRQVSYGSPVLATLAGFRQILSVNEDNLSSHDPNNGKTLWSFKWPGKSAANASVSQPVLAGDDRVLLSKGYGGGAALLRVAAAEGRFTVEEIWRDKRLLKTKFTNIVIYGGYAYGLSDGILECVELASGKRQWKRGRYGHGQVLGVGELLLVQAESGEVALVEATPERFREPASFPALDGKTWNNLCLYGKFLLVRNAEEAACYRLPLEGANGDEA